MAVTRLNPVYADKSGFQELNAAWSTFNANMQFLARGTLIANATVQIPNDAPHSVFIVFFGTWNFSGAYLVFPNNGGTPVSFLLGKHSNNPMCSITANGSWGITIKNTHASVAQPYSVIRIMK